MLAGGIIASKWFVKMEGTMNEQSIALKLDDVEFLSLIHISEPTRPY